MKRTDQYPLLLAVVTNCSIALVAAISGTALIGCLSGFLLIPRAHTSFIPLASCTALFFLILCGDLCIFHRFSDKRIVQTLAPLAALSVAAISTVIFLDYFVDTRGVNLDAITTGRMLQPSAIRIALAGLAFFLLTNFCRQKRLFRLGPALLATTVTTISLGVLFRYLHAAPLLHGGAFIPEVLPTAITFIVLGMGLCSSAGYDLFSPGDTEGARLIRTFLLLTVAIGLIQGSRDALYYSGVTNPSRISSLMTLFCMGIVGFLITALSRIISCKVEAAETERKLADRELCESEERFRAFFENSIDAMFLWSPDGTIYSANPEACRIFGMTKQEIYSIGFEGLLDQDKLLHEARSERQRTGKFRGELTGVKRGRTKFPIEISSCVFKNKDGLERISSTVRDITGQKRAQEELRESNKRLYMLSNTDPLTHLYNRRHLMESLDKEMKRLERTKSEITLLLFDVDHFKTVNDAFGHQEGDAVLVAVAKVAQEMLRCNDIAARYGGEEFVLLLPETSLVGGVTVAERLREAVQALSFAAPVGNLTVTVSVGVATFPSDSVDGVDSLLHMADQALYRAKNSGRNRVEIMTSSLQLAS